MSANRTQSKFIRLVYVIPVVIRDVLISTTFIIIGEMSYEVILSKLQLVRARLVIKQTTTGQVSCIIQLEDGKVKIRFLIFYKNAIFCKLNKKININSNSGNIQLV